MSIIASRFPDHSMNPLDNIGNTGNTGTTVVHPKHAIPTSKIRANYTKGAWFLLILNVLDVTTTFYALSLGASEFNPIAQFLIDTYMLIPAKVLVCSIVLWGAYQADEEIFTRARVLSGVWLLCGMYCIVIFMNSIAIHRLLN